MQKELKLAILIGLLFASSTHAEIVSVKGTVKSIDSVERLLELTLESGTIELEVSRKAEVTADGQAVELNDVSTGQKVSVKYHEDLDIVVEIKIDGSVPSSSDKVVELLEVSELSPNGNPQYPWLSPDGLTIYWEERESGGSSIWTAVRDDVDSLFEEKKRLVRGRHPTVSADGREMILLVDGVLHSTTRSSIDDTFKRPRAIRELRDQQNVKNPSLSEDGLTLYFNRGGTENHEFAMSGRIATSSSWGRPKTFRVQHTEVKGFLTWPFVSNDGLRLLCTNEGSGRSNGNLMIWTRKTTNDSFREFEFIEVPDTDPIFGRSPRFVESTGELFFTSPKPEAKMFGISVIKNFASTLE